jgi:hypothetical protein
MRLAVGAAPVAYDRRGLLEQLLGRHGASRPKVAAQGAASVCRRGPIPSRAIA